jgi:16S rRNA (guanine527-N7)-methyltransferase
VDTSVIGQLLQPYIQLDESRFLAISKYIDLLLKWNARTNLTAIREPEEIVRRHFGESFFAAQHALSDGRVESIIDLGSGAGFPGLPFAMMVPEAQVTLIEANHKKAAFLRETIFSLNLKNTKVFGDRGENYNQQADLVTMRAVESFDKALSTAIRLTKPKGRLVLMIGSAQVSEAMSMGEQMEWNDPVRPPEGHSRALLMGTKIK